MVGFPQVSKDDLDAAQRGLWDELTLGPRGFYTGGEKATKLPDLYNAWLQFPEFGRLMLGLGDAVRDRKDLPGRSREIIVLTTSARLGAWVEFDFHVPFARNEGLSDAVIAAIREGREPEFAEALDLATWQANGELLETGTLRPQTRERLVELIGHPGLMQLLATVMLYVITAWTTNVARVELAKDFAADPELLKSFFAGRSVAAD